MIEAAPQPYFFKLTLLNFRESWFLNTGNIFEIGLRDAQEGPDEYWYKVRIIGLALEAGQCRKEMGWVRNIPFVLNAAQPQPVGRFPLGLSKTLIAML